MGKYTQDAQQLLRLIGGKENIAAVSHCVTIAILLINANSRCAEPPFAIVRTYCF